MPIDFYKEPLEKISRSQLSPILRYATAKFGQTDIHADIHYEIPNSTPSVLVYENSKN